MTEPTFLTMALNLLESLASQMKCMSVLILDAKVCHTSDQLANDAMVFVNEIRRKQATDLKSAVEEILFEADLRVLVMRNIRDITTNGMKYQAFETSKDKYIVLASGPKDDKVENAIREALKQESDKP